MSSIFHSVLESVAKRETLVLFGDLTVGKQKHTIKPIKV